MSSSRLVRDIDQSSVFNSILFGENSSYLAKIWVVIIVVKKKKSFIEIQLLNIL